METNIPNVLAKKYKELIKYISQIGNSAEYHWDSDRIIIKVQNNAKEDILFIKLHQPPYAANPEQEIWKYIGEKPMCVTMVCPINSIRIQTRE